MGATIGTRLFTFLNGQKVGQDEFGNQYYTMKKPAKKGRTRRWVIFNGKVEASKIPPLWHGWLHHTIDVPPSEANYPKYDWQEPHIPNLTGTKGAYFPEGSLMKSGKRAATTSDYEAWSPPAAMLATAETDTANAES